MTFHKPFHVVGTPSGPSKRPSLWFCCLNPVKPILVVLLMIQAPGLAPAQQYRKAMFPHRSVGLCFWDRSQVSCLTPPTTIANEIAKYNLSNSYTGVNAVSMVDFPLEPGGDTLVNDIGNDWYDWVNVFSGANAWSSTFYSLMDQYPIVIVKTGYPATQYMTSPDSITAYENHWRIIINYMRNRPQNFFVITTNYPAATDGHATRDEYSNIFCTWAKTVLAEGNDSFGPFPKNVYVFDWFHMLASFVDGYCDPMYGSVGEANSNPGCPGPGGDHPSNLAVAMIDPLFVQQIFDMAITYESKPLATTWAGPPTLTINNKNQVQVKWETLSEINTYRFYVQRSGQTIDSVNAGGTSLSERYYAVTDSTVPAGAWIYRIMEVDLNGSIHYSQTVSTTVLSVNVSDPLGTVFALEQNYPNPFNPSTTIRYGLPVGSHVTLSVYNTLGQQVAALVNETQVAGYHEVKFDGSNLASGVYFYRIQAGGLMQTKELLLLR